MVGLLSPAPMGPAQRFLLPGAPTAPAAPAMQQQAPMGGGLLSMFAPKAAQSPFYQAFDQRRNAISNMLLGGVGAETPLERMRGMAQGLQRGGQADMLYATEMKKQRENQRVVNETIELLTRQSPSLVPWVKAGALSPGDAFNTMMAAGGPIEEDEIQSYMTAKESGYSGSLAEFIARMRGGNQEYGLTPQYGIDANGNPVLIQLSKSGEAKQTQLPEGVQLSKTPIKLDAGTHYVLLDPITRQPVGSIPKETYQESFDRSAGAAAGKGAGEAQATYASMMSKMPGLEHVVRQLDVLSEKATYTAAGQLIDEAMKQAGMEPREAAVARAEYIAMVDNQILPLLRDTFGAQFTQREGETLRATLGDPNKSPREKQAVLKSFIEQKRRDVAALAGQAGIGAVPPATIPGEGVPEGVDPGLWQYMTPEEKALWQ